MKLFRKKSDVNLEALRDITEDVQESDFVPYTCHYDSHTILTKNGELLQTIKITGFAYEVIGSDIGDLRQTIREAILDAIDDTSYAIWFHTIRRRKNLDPAGDFPNQISRLIHTAWKEQNQLTQQFTNELYVTIVREGQSASILTPQDFLRGLVPMQERRYREEYLKQSQVRLDKVVTEMLDVLELFGAQRLGIVERDGIFYSELQEFLNKIINLTDDEVPVADIDLSQYLTTQEITFGHNAMEVRSHQGRRRFGSLLTLKEHGEIPIIELDRFLQLPLEFIVTECLDFINREKALGAFEEQKRLTQISGDAKLADQSGLNDIIESDRGSPIDYGEHQTTVFLIADSIRALEDHVERTAARLGGMGIIPIREDLKFEECYWAQLPGNFEFIKRLKPINTRRVGAFASLYNFPSGRATGNLWGPAVTMLHTALGTPYFFNFHLGDSGHTMMTGPAGSLEPTRFLHFLLSEAQKFHPRIFYIDMYRRAEILLRAMGGTYHRLGVESTADLNPLQLQDSTGNRHFLVDWITALLEASDEYRPTIEQAVGELYSLPPEKRTFSYLAAHFSAHQPILAEKLSVWHNHGAYRGLIDGERDTISFSQPILGIDLTALLNKPDARRIVFAYLLHRITQQLDGTPTIIVISDAWSLLDTSLLGPRLPSWLDVVRRKNGMAILTTEHGEQVARSPMTAYIAPKLATSLHFPDPDLTPAFQEVMQLDSREWGVLNEPVTDHSPCLLKRGSDGVVLHPRLEALKAFHALLSPTEESLAKMERLLREAGPTPGSWLGQFLETK